MRRRGRDVRVRPSRSLGANIDVVDAGRDDLDAFGIGVVQRRELRAFVLGRGEHHVGARDHVVFDAGAQLRIIFDTGIGLDARERMERGCEREVELVLQPVCDGTGEPVVARGARRPVATRAAAPRDASTKGSTRSMQLVLRNRGDRTGLHVQHAESRLDDHDLALVRVLGAGVDVALDTGPGERRRERCDVHVHAAAVARTRLGERRRVHAEHGNAALGHRGVRVPSGWAMRIRRLPRRAPGPRARRCAARSGRTGRPRPEPASGAGSASSR